MKKITVWSICSWIEAASFAWQPLGFEFKWFSEIAPFPSEVLNQKYPNIENLGDMTLIPDEILNGSVFAPDLICWWTPCQAFSLAWWQKWLNDERGNLTLKFIDIINANDKIRKSKKQNKTIIFRENVEWVLKDKTNAFGCFVSYLAWLEEPLQERKWPNAGIIYWPERNVARRVLDAKYFWLPQQRKRLYVLAWWKDFHPENILFEPLKDTQWPEFPKYNLEFKKDGHNFQVFREYTDCLYSAYGTKRNWNAAAYNWSLFVVQDWRIRRLSPLECERLMWFSDDYTKINISKNTTRYQAVWNSWAIPVVKRIWERIKKHSEWNLQDLQIESNPMVDSIVLFDNINVCRSLNINALTFPNDCIFSSMVDIVAPNDDENLFISSSWCKWILRRSFQRNININSELKRHLETTANV